MIKTRVPFFRFELKLGLHCSAYRQFVTHIDADNLTYTPARRDKDRSRGLGPTLITRTEGRTHIKKCLPVV